MQGTRGLAVRPVRKPFEEGGSAAEGNHMHRRDGVLAEGVFDLVEQTLAVAVGLRVWRAKDLGELLEKVTLLVGQTLRCLDDDGDELVSAAAAPQMRDALAP